MFAQLDALVLIQGHRITGSRRLSAEERCPIVVEVPETGGYFYRSHLDVAQARIDEEGLQWFRSAQREPHALVQEAGAGAERTGRVPEVAINSMPSA